MRTICRIVGLFAVLSLGSPVSAQQERIRDFHSEIRLQSDGALQVQETITVVSAGRQIRHGIFRDFPTHYKDRLGNNYVVGFQWIGAVRDGQPEFSRVEDYANGKRIYLGDKNTYLSRGEHTYQLTYSTNRQLGFFADHDELYWNVTGNGWSFPIDHASATVALPPQIPTGEIGLSGFTGLQGSLEKELTSTTEDGLPQFATTRALGPNEGLSIVVSWPKGLIAPPTPQQRLNDFFADNRDALVLSLAFLLLALYYALAWYAVGRDPQPGVIMPLYEPPGGLSPAAMRYLARMGFDNKTFASAILDMAARGFLKIKFQAGSYTLYRTQADNRSLTPDEQQLAGVMFGGRDQLWLHNENHLTISAGIAALKQWLKKSEQTVYFRTNSVYVIPAVVFSVLATLGVAYMRSPVSILLVGFVSFWLSIWSLAVAGMVIACCKGWKAALTARTGSGPLAGKALVLTLFTLPFMGGEGLGIFMLVKSGSLPISLFLFASIALHITFYWLLKAPTAAGRQLLDKVQGFKMFLGAVDGDRLNRMNPPEQTPKTFEKFLPYALALDVEQAWADKFSGVLSVASESNQSGTRLGLYSVVLFRGWLGHLLRCFICLRIHGQFRQRHFLFLYRSWFQQWQQRRRWRFGRWWRRRRWRRLVRKV